MKACYIVEQLVLFFGQTSREKTPMNDFDKDIKS